jgi:1-acyl-sn-glycerol-3-phosphate acyltransferase
MGAELGLTAAAKSGELGRTAAVKGGEISKSAAVKGAEVSRTAAVKGGEMSVTAARAAAGKGAALGRNVARLDVPWVRWGIAQVMRAGIIDLGLGQILKGYARIRVQGRDQFKAIDGPVVLVANHSSHLDVLTLLRALPRDVRRRTAVAAAADYFYSKRTVAHAIALTFNTVPLARTGGGARNGGIDHVDKLIDDGWNLVLFPEGTRSRDGSIGRLRSGAAVIAAQHDIPIVPIYLKGTYDTMPPGRNWPARKPGRFVSRRHTIEATIGCPIRGEDGQPPSEVMQQVRVFFEAEAGIVPAPDLEPMQAPLSPAA